MLKKKISVYKINKSITLKTFQILAQCMPEEERKSLISQLGVKSLTIISHQKLSFGRILYYIRLKITLLFLTTRLLIDFSDKKIMFVKANRN